MERWGSLRALEVFLIVRCDDVGLFALLLCWSVGVWADVFFLVVFFFFVRAAFRGGSTSAWEDYSVVLARKPAKVAHEAHWCVSVVFYLFVAFLEVSF